MADDIRYVTMNNRKIISEVMPGTGSKCPPPLPTNAIHVAATPSLTQVYVNVWHVIFNTTCYAYSVW